MANSKKKDPFYVVGIGASAGGLDALERFFGTAPSEGGLAYVVVQHLSPDYKSLMAELLAKRTDMPVLVAEDGVLVEPNHVYLIPPNKSITIFDKKLYLAKREMTGSLYLPIDIFFRSLAQDFGEKGIGVILSGTGSDGTRGIRAIKEHGGLVLAQDERSAKFSGMPNSAIATKMVDYILPPEQMVREILSYLQHPLLAADDFPNQFGDSDEESLSKIFSLLRGVSGVDFTNYKQNTMLRRIKRRMGIKQAGSLNDYLYLLHRDLSEVNNLYHEFLIGVTSFFRDAEAFKILEKDVIPKLFESKKRGETLRVWIAGCSTGEEAYSIAILLMDYMEETGQYLDVKVFATDLDKDALDYAGKGIYPESIAADLSTEHLANYFVRQGGYYAIKKRGREKVIFAKQNIIMDPPFSKVDLISCRNVLIYLQPVLQRKVISAFQFALNPGGYLFLGTSETLGEADEFFLSTHNKWKIYHYKGGFRPALNLTREPSFSSSPTQSPDLAGETAVAYRWRTEEALQRAVIESFLPPTVVVDDKMSLIYLAGDLDPYLRISTGGLFSANILKRARDGLSTPLSTAIHKVLKDGKELFYKNVQTGNEQAPLVDIIAKPYTIASQHKMVLLQFSPVVSMEVNGDQDSERNFDMDANVQQRVQDLENELQYTRENLQATVEELETSNEELQATNEELFASNEELQSTNEELHSVNEELITVNAEYHAKIQELSEVNAGFS